MRQVVLGDLRDAISHLFDLLILENQVLRFFLIHREQHVWCGDFERDITLCIGVFMFIKDTDQIVESLANIRKMTKKGGLFLTVNTHLSHLNAHDQTLRNFDFASNELANLAAPYFTQEVLTPISRAGNIYGPASALNSLEEFEQECLDVQLMKVPVTHFMSVMRAI